MGLEKRTIKIIVCVFAILAIIGGSIGLLLTYVLYQPPYIELEVWPLPADDGRLIWFIEKEPDTWHRWVRSINEFLEAYETASPENPPNAPCSMHPNSENPQRSEDCAHAMRYWSPCSVDTFYEYIRGTPCVFLRLTHIEQWTPQPYSISEDLPIPSEMPEHLKEGLKHPSAKLENYIWVSCSADPAGSVGAVRYIPETQPPGFPVRRLRTADRSEAVLADDGGPLVAVLFQNLTRGVTINVECRIWTKDVVYSTDENIGRTHFEIIVE